MLKPKYLEQLPENLIELYSQLEMDILADMARRISIYNYYIPAAQWQYRKMIELGNYNSFITKALATRTKKAEKEIKRLMEEAAMETLSFDDAVYQLAGLEVPPLSASPALLDVLNAGLKKTNGLFQNLTRTTAGASTRQFEKALDRAYLQIVSGGFDQNTAIRNAIKSLARDGVSAIVYPSGRTDHLETAVRRAIVTGVNQTALQLQDARADELGSDLVETTAHAGARPSHAEWQGRVFSRSGKSKKYPDFKQSTRYGYGDGLGGWNCRHSYFPFFEGVSHKAYTNAQLKDYDAKKYQYDGRKLTEYEASQIQRGIERNIRRWKREEKAMKAAGLPTEEAKAKVSKWQGEQRSFIEQTELKRQYDREQVYSKGIKAEKAVMLRRTTLEKKADSMYNLGSSDANLKAYLEDKPIRDKIKSDIQIKTVEIGKQGKHIKGHNNYIEGRSFLTISADDAQKIIDKYAGKGKPLKDSNNKWKNTELIHASKSVGYTIDLDGNEVLTDRAIIHYSKRGTHIVPTLRKE